MDADLARRHLTEVGHSMNMIAELPRYTGDSDVPFALRAAALDAFFIHLRLLIEFLITKPQQNKPPAISRWDYASGFGLDNALRDRLTKAAGFASAHVAHFNASRAPTAGTPAGLTPSSAALTGYRDDVLASMDALVQHLSKRRSVYAADLGGLLKAARQRVQV